MSNRTIDKTLTDAIISEIKEHIGISVITDVLFLANEHEKWYCGITNNSQRRKSEHQKEKDIKALRFKSWDAKTKDNASYIEDYFHSQGMLNAKGARGARINSTNVYVFIKNSSLLDEVGFLLGLLK